MSYTAAAHHGGSFPDWGDVPTWVLAGIALLALIASVYAARIFYRQLKLLEAEQNRQATERRSTQASSVSAWVEGWSAHGGVSKVMVRNGSEEPIWHVTLFVDSHWGPDHDTETRELGVVPPKETIEVPVVLDVPTSALSGLAPPVRLEFDDAGGRIWRRNERGHLHEFVVPDGQDRPPRSIDWGDDWGDHPAPRKKLGEAPRRRWWRRK